MASLSAEHIESLREKILEQLGEVTPLEIYREEIDRLTIELDSGDPRRIREAKKDFLEMLSTLRTDPVFLNCVLKSFSHEEKASYAEIYRSMKEQ